MKDKSKKSGKSSKKNEAPRDRNKLRKERAFLFFIAHNPHYLQNKKFLSQFILPLQMLVLREIAMNELAKNIPTCDRPKKKRDAMENICKCLIRLSHGEMDKRNLYHHLDTIQILAAHVIEHNELC